MVAKQKNSATKFEDVALPLLSVIMFIISLHHSKNVTISYRTQHYTGERDEETEEGAFRTK
jgi:hypothetical protein